MVQCFKFAFQFFKAKIRNNFISIFKWLFRVDLCRLQTQEGVGEKIAWQKRETQHEQFGDGDGELRGSQNDQLGIGW